MSLSALLLVIGVGRAGANGSPGFLATLYVAGKTGQPLIYYLQFMLVIAAIIYAVGVIVMSLSALHFIFSGNKLRKDLVLVIIFWPIYIFVYGIQSFRNGVK